MLELGYRTPDEWARRAIREPRALLSDHAHCELRAASSAQALITRNPEAPGLVDRLAAVATEEMRHFRRVLRSLRTLGGELREGRGNPYVEGLMARSGPTRGAVLLDRLLISALIERRSLERFELLARAADKGGGAGGARLAELYSRLIPSEGAHAELFCELAREAFPGPLVRRRLAALVGMEAAVVGSLPFAARIHSGLA